MERKYNTRNSAVKRLMKEAYELREPTDEYCAQPLEDNLFEWHFTVHGSPNSDFEGGVYHGRILLPADYPMKPPNIILLTPNGRFEINKKICLNISGHHPELWQPSWSIRTVLLALIAFMTSPGNGAIGSLEYTPKERKILAKKSHKWECNECGKITNLLSNLKSQPVTKEESDMINKIAMKADESTKKDADNNLSDEEVSNVQRDFTNTDESLENSSDILGSSIAENDRRIIANSSNNNIQTLFWAVIAVIVLLIARRLFVL